MSWILIFLTTAFPMYRLLRANWRTSLRHSSFWTIVAWCCWGVVLVLAARSEREPNSTAVYFALSLTACAAAAVLGARWPHVRPWNFVVLGLLGVFLLPLAEQHVTGAPLLSGLPGWFVVGILSIGVINYVPTRFTVAALAVGAGCAGAIALLMFQGTTFHGLTILFPSMLLVAPWAAYLGSPSRNRPVVSSFDALWLDFRDRYGLLWAQRIREQFNTSVQNAGLPVRLGWGGLRSSSSVDPPDEKLMSAATVTLVAVRKRFFSIE
jgi:hypothetical protein